MLLASASGSGIAKLLDDEVEIAASSRQLSAGELSLARERRIAIKTFQIGFDAVSIVVHPSTYKYVKELTRARAKAIFFTGKITDWSQLDPAASGPITVYGRDRRLSGTSAAFADWIVTGDRYDYVESTIFVERTDLMVQVVAKDPNGIGYSSFGLLDESVRSLAIGNDLEEAVPPTNEHVVSRKYPLTRGLFLATRGTPKGPVNDFIRFMLSQAGQNTLNEAGMIGIY